MEEQTATPNEPQKKISPLMIVWQSLIIILILAALLGTVLALKTISKLKLTSEQTITNIHQKLLQSEQMHATDQQLHQQLSQQISQLQKSVSEVSQVKSASQQQWTLREIAYSLKLANLNLRYHHNLDETINMLQATNEEIQNTADATLSLLHQQLSQSLQELQNIPHLDQAELLTKIASLIKQSRLLPLIEANKGVVEKSLPTDSRWKQMIEKSWLALQKIIVIRHVNQTLPWQLMPPQRAILEQTIQILLLQTQWAILKIDPLLYKTNLEQLKTVINTYFDTNQSSTQQFLISIEQLQSIDIKPKLPDLTNSINLLNSIIEKKNQEDKS